MSDPTPIKIPTRMAAFPKVTDLPHGTRKAVAEYEDLYARLDALVAHHANLTAPETVAAAAQADTEARAKAVRSGKEAVTVKATAAAKLEDQTAAAEAELRAVVEAIGQVSGEVQAAMVEAWEDDEASGRAAANRAAVAYRDLVESIVSARAQVVAAQTLPLFVQRIAHFHVIGSDSPPVRMQAPQRRLPVLGLNLDAHNAMPIDTFVSLLSHDAGRLCELAENPYAERMD